MFLDISGIKYDKKNVILVKLILVIYYDDNFDVLAGNSLIESD